MKGACDCHVHIYGPRNKYPQARNRVFTAGEASVDEMLALHARIGIDRVVIVQPSSYGTDNSCTLDAIRRLGARARGIAVIDRSSNLVEKHALGIRGVRVNLQNAGEDDPVRARAALEQAAARVAPFGWHVQVFTNVKVIASLEKALAEMPVPVVVDHFGLPESMEELAPLVRLVKSGAAYVKLSAPHRFALDAARVARALIEANPDRLLWGTDWPHPAVRHTVPPERVEPFEDIDDGAGLARLREWTPDEAVFRKILVENPARLYDF